LAFAILKTDSIDAWSCKLRTVAKSDRLQQNFGETVYDTHLNLYQLSGNGHPNARSTRSGSCVRISPAKGSPLLHLPRQLAAVEIGVLRMAKLSI